MEEKIDRKNRITKAQFDMIKITGRIWNTYSIRR